MQKYMEHFDSDALYCRSVGVVSFPLGVRKLLSVLCFALSINTRELVFVDTINDIPGGTGLAPTENTWKCVLQPP